MSSEGSPSIRTVARVYEYADETGDLGYHSEALYFGVDTATFHGDHSREILQGAPATARSRVRRVRMRPGLHAKDDSHATRAAMFELIAQQRPRFDTTFLNKSNAYAGVRSRGPVYLYQSAIYQHFKEILRQVSESGASRPTRSAAPSTTPSPMCASRS